MKEMLEHYSKRTKIIVVLVALLLVYFLFFHHSKSKATNDREAKVVIQQPAVKKIADYIIQTGNTAAYQSVDLVARVEGYLQKQSFVDGAIVKKGQPLFLIEPKPYLEQLKEAQATVKSKEASLEYADAEYGRQQKMYKQNATSLNSVEKWRAKRDESIAGLAQSKANVANAQITYGYTHISAPFEGRIGRHLVDVGNLVGNGQATKLATVDQIDPIYVYFNLNELDLLRLRDAARKEGITSQNISKIPVFVKMQDEDSFKHKGHLDFVNIALNSSTGTLEFRALLENKGYPLVPGLFVQIKIPYTDATDHLLVPSQAILYDQVGPYLLIANQEDVVESRRVTPGQKDGDMTVISQGIKAEDRVIVEGLQNAMVGKKVFPQTESQGG